MNGFNDKDLQAIWEALELPANIRKQEQFEEMAFAWRDAERTCKVEDGPEYDDLLDMWTVGFSCGHVVHPAYNYVPAFCEVCGAKVVSE